MTGAVAEVVTQVFYIGVSFYFRHFWCLLISGPDALFGSQYGPEYVWNNCIRMPFIQEYFEAKAPPKNTNIYMLKVFAVVVLLSLLIFWLYPKNEYLKKLSSVETRYSKRFRPRQRCDCKDVENNFKIGTVRSTCSQEASEAGLHQNVVTYSYFNGKRMNRNYTLDIKENLENIRNFYPGWFMRVYSNMPLTIELCNLVCENKDFFFCPVEHADAIGIGNVSAEFPMQWRFLVLSDPTVQKFLVRDLDSRITQREVDAVKEWQGSDKIFHAMRDHPAHETAILGGMWGGNNLLLDSNQKSLQKKIVMNRKIRCCGVDQAALEIYIYPFWRQNQLMIHDSYLCHKYKDSVPFPTQRIKLNEFVGRPLDEIYKNYTVEICPEKCRPSYGQDWIYC